MIPTKSGNWGGWPSDQSRCDGCFDRRNVPTSPAAPPEPVVASLARQMPREIDALREERVQISKLRQVIAGRLKIAQNNAAMLTTFNEVDMSQVMAMRAEYKQKFEMALRIRSVSWACSPLRHSGVA